MAGPKSDHVCLGTEVVGASEALRRYARSLVDNHKHDSSFDLCSPIRYEVRVGHIDGEPVPRLVIFLRGSGCEWIKSGGGGCTMCGFFAATAHGRLVSTAEYVQQLSGVLRRLEGQRFPIVCLYNDGSLLNEAEVTRPALLAMARIVASQPGVRRLLVESRVEHIKVETLKEIRENLGSMELEVAIGLETVNDAVRSLCINKGLTLDAFEKAVERIYQAGCRVRPLLLVKPPFLTESEAIEDVMCSVRYLRAMGIHTVDLEAVTVESGTVVHQLWQAGLYRVPWLWSLVEILENTGPDYPVYMSPFSYSVDALDSPKNCPHCSDSVRRGILTNYNRRFDRGTITLPPCECRAAWEQEKARTDSRPLDLRVLEALAELASRSAEQT